MRISDWSSDVCSSYLNRVVVRCREADWQSPWCGDRRIAMTGATPLPPLRPLALYAIGLGSNRRHVRFGDPRRVLLAALAARSEEHTSELRSLMRLSFAVFCLKKKKAQRRIPDTQ